MKSRTLLERSLGTGLGFLLAAGAAFVANVLLSNMLDPDGYGSVVLMFTWATIAAQFAQLGFLRGSTKVVSVARMNGDLPTIKSFLVFTMIAVTVGAALAGLLLFFAIKTLVPADTIFWTLACFTGLLLLPLSLCRVSSGVMLGESRNFPGAFFQSGLPYAGMLLAVISVMALNDKAGLETVVPALVIGAYGAMLVAIGAVIWVSRDAWAVRRARFEAVPWLSLAIPLMLIGTTQILSRQVGTVVVGGLESADSVAAYYPALRISEFATFGLIAINAAVAARLSTAYARKDRALLQSTLTRAAILSMSSTIALVIALFLFEDFLLGLFGGVAESGRTALTILLLGQIVVAGTGSVGVLMAMSGQERFAAGAGFVVLVVNVGLHFLLVPLFGINGAALATAVSVVLWNLTLLTRSLRALHVNPTVFTKNLFRVFR